MALLPVADALDAVLDVLLAGPPSLRKRLHVSEKDIQAAPADAQGNRVVTTSAGPGTPSK